MGIIALVIIFLGLVLFAAAAVAIVFFLQWLERDREKPRGRGPRNDD
jgi:uncharacterized protein involved in exopolysaccharide biosynthesis